MSRWDAEDIERGTREMPFFRSEHERDEIFLIAERLVRLIKDGGYENIVFIDASARPIATGLTAYWHKAFPNERLPHIAFLNPEAFHSDDPAENHFEDMMRDIALFARRGMPKELQASIPSRAIEHLQEVHRRLMEQKDKPTLMVDTCLHTGATTQKVTQALKESGVENVTVAAVSEDPRTRAQADIYLLEGESLHRCWPYGPETLVEKGDEVVSRPVEDPAGKIAGRRLRDEIHDIIEERFNTEQAGLDTPPSRP